MRLLLLAGMTALVAGSLGTPAPAGAQIWKRVKEKATEKIVDRTVDKVKERRAKADSAVEARAGQTVDSAAGSIGRGVDSTMERVGRAVDTTTGRVAGLADTAVQRSSRGVGRAVNRGGGEKGASTLARDFASGHVVLNDVQFAKDGTVESASLGRVRELAALIKGASGGYALEVHTGPGAAAQAASDARARALKAALVAEGVDAGRVWARGVGASQPPAAGLAADRIDVTRMQ